MPSLGRCTIPNRSYHVSIAPRECYNAWGWYRVAAWLPHRCKKERQNDPWDEPCNCRHEIDHSPSQCLLPSKLPYRISIYTSLYTQESARALAARSRSLLGSHLDKRDLAFLWRVEGRPSTMYLHRATEWPAFAKNQRIITSMCRFVS